MNYRSNNGGKMNAKPTNRNLLIEIPVEEAEEVVTTFLLPEDYLKKDMPRYTAVKIVDISHDCQKFSEIHKNRRCVVETTMINEIRVGSESYSIIGENYVVLMLED